MHAHRTAGSRDHGRIKDSGEDKRPTMREREKLSVARAERNMPSRRREKHCISVYCWSVGRNLVVMRLLMIWGRKTLAMAKMANVGVCNCLTG